MIPITFAPSVPDEIRRWAIEQLNKVGTSRVRKEISDRIRRLLSYNTKDLLWTPLIRLNGGKPVSNLLGLIQCAVTAPAEFCQLSKQPIHLVKRDATDLARRAQTLARDLSALMRQVSQQNRHALSFYRIAMTAAGESSDPLHIHLLTDLQLQAELHDFEKYAPGLPALVVAMSSALKIIANDEANLRPRKMQASSAERTFVIITIKRYFCKEIGRVPNSLVAKVVNITLDRQDTNADTVRKALP